MSKDTVQLWKLLSSTTALDEKWFPVRKDAVELPNGKVINDYFVWEAPHIVSVVAVTTEQKFVIAQQYRHALGKVTYQFPAGAVDKGESPEEAARRELLEETGFTAEKFVHLATLNPYATKMTGLDDIFIAQGAHQVAEPHYDPQEESLAYTWTLDELYAYIESGEVLMTQVPAILLLALRHLPQA